MSLFTPQLTADGNIEVNKFLPALAKSPNMFDFLQYYGSKRPSKNEKRLQLTPFPVKNRPLIESSREPGQKYQLKGTHQCQSDPLRRSEPVPPPSIKQHVLTSQQLSKLLEQYHRKQMLAKQPTQSRITPEDPKLYSNQAENQVNSLISPPQAEVFQGCSQETGNGLSAVQGDQKLHLNRTTAVKPLEMPVVERSYPVAYVKSASIRHYPHQAIPGIISSISYPIKSGEPAETKS